MPFASAKFTVIERGHSCPSPPNHPLSAARNAYRIHDRRCARTIDPIRTQTDGKSAGADPAAKAENRPAFRAAPAVADHFAPAPLEPGRGFLHPCGKRSDEQDMRETELYAPVKAFLEAQGYEVKAEVGPADVMARRGDEPPVIVELKTGFSLALVHQGIARQSVSDVVYLAIPRKTGRPFQIQLKSMKTLCRRLGLGLITIRTKDDLVEVHCDPGPYRPRENKARKERLLREFAKRSGDPNTGGATRQGLVTAYRQDAIRCATFLAEQGPSKGAVVARETGVERATRMMADNHYGWFERQERGIYALCDFGQTALKALPPANNPD